MVAAVACATKAKHAITLDNFIAVMVLETESKEKPREQNLEHLIYSNYHANHALYVEHKASGLQDDQNSLEPSKPLTSPHRPQKQRRRLRPKVCKSDA